MKKLAFAIVVLGLIIFLYPKKYTTFPGFVTTDYFQDFMLTKKNCIGFSFAIKGDIKIADAPNEALCFGWLK